MSGCRPLNESEQQLVLEKLTKPRDKALFVIGLRTGFRISELLSLRIKDVWAAGKCLDTVKVARRNMKGGRGEGKGSISSREVALHAAAQAAIEALNPATLDPEAPLFPSREGKGKAITRFQAQLILKTAYAAAGLVGTLATHTMRKTFGEKVYALTGKDIMETMDALGHKHVTSTQRYLTVNKANVRKAILA